MASRELHCRYSVLSILILSLLLISSTSVLIGNEIGNDDTSGKIVENPSRRDLELNTPLRSTNEASVDIKSTRESFSCTPGEDLTFNFTVEELNGVNITINNAVFELYSYDESIIHDTMAAYGLGIAVPGGSIVDGQASVIIPSDLYIKASRIGDDGVFLKVYINGIDEKGNTINTIIWSRATVTMKVAVLVHENIESIIRSNLNRYYSDVKEKNDVEFIERSESWETPESVREDLISLWENESITGAILIGDMPYAVWEINHSDGSKEPCPIPIFYEDLDGEFKDNNSNGSYDLHFWGENDGPEIWVSFLSPPSETIPSTHLRTGGGVIVSGLTGRYYSDNNFQYEVLTRVDQEIEFYWMDKDPPSPVPDDGFSIIWSGQVLIDKSETYTFELIHAGGIVFEVDGVEYLRDDHCPPWNRKMKNVDLDLTAGWHDIQLSYRENGWGDHKGRIRLCWRSNGTVGRLINDWFDKDHSYYTGEMGAPERGLLFMDYAYGMQSNMLQPIKERHMEPLFGEHLDVGGGQNTTNATEYLEFLDLGHDLTSIWTHAGGGGHQFGVPPDSGAEFSAAQTYQIKETQGSLVTLIWGCHAGDFANTGYSGSVTKTENLVVNYAFDTEYGLAAMGCTRSYGTTFDRVYHDLKEGSYLGLGYFHFKEIGYDKEKRMSEPHPLGEKMWIEDEVMFGDPFIRIYHFPEIPEVEIENGSRFTTGDNVSISIESSGAEEMRITYEYGNTGWIDFDESPILDIATSNGILDVIVETRNGFGQAARESSDRIYIESTPPIIGGFTINGGETATNDSSVFLEMDLSDDLSGLDAMCFSNNGINWTEWEDIAGEKIWDLGEGDGEKTIRIKVRDAVGNIATASATIELDTTGPVVWIDLIGNEGNNGWYNSFVEFSFYSLDDDISSIRYRIGDAEWGEYENPVTLVGDGIHIIDFYSIDDLGNRGPMDNTTVALDRTAPINVSVRSLDNIIVTNQSVVTILIEGEETGSGMGSMSFKIYDDDWGPWIPFNSSYDLYLGESEGDKRVDIRIRDIAGNTMMMSDVIPLYLDTSAPYLMRSDPMDGEKIDTYETISFTFSEWIERDSVEIRVFDQDWNDIPFSIEEIYDTIEIEPELKGYMTCNVIISGNLSDYAGNRIGESIFHMFHVLGIPPEPPVRVNAQVEDENVFLNWYPPLFLGNLPISHYNIYRIEEGSDWILIGNTSSTSFIDPWIDPGATYLYKIAAYNGFEESGHSDEVSVTIPDLTVDNATDDDQDDYNDDKTLRAVFLLIGVIMVLILTFILIVYLFMIRKREIPPEE